MKQETIEIKDTSSKLIKVQLDKIIESGKRIIQIVPLNKTSFLVLVESE